MVSSIFTTGNTQAAMRKVVERLKFFGGTGGKDYTALETSTGYTFIGGRSNTHICYNCRFDGTSWLRYNTADTATVLVVSNSGSVLNYYAAAGANPITWTNSTLASGPDSGWVALGGFGANWSSYVATADFRAEYRKLASGLVLLRGLVKKTAALAYVDTISTGIPAGFRPGVVTARQQVFNQANAAIVATDLRVAWDGSITLHSGGSNLWLSLDGISYLAEA